MEQAGSLRFGESQSLSSPPALLGDLEISPTRGLSQILRTPLAETKTPCLRSSFPARTWTVGRKVNGVPANGIFGDLIASILKVGLASVLIKQGFKAAFFYCRLVPVKGVS